MKLKKILKEQTLSLEGERTLFNNILKGSPNPKFEHSSIISLNGRYNLEITKNKLIPPKYSHEVIVPYVIESILSQYNKLHKNNFYYHFKYDFELIDKDIKDIMLLNVTKVEGDAEIYINGKYITNIVDEFNYQINIKDYLVSGLNTINLAIKGTKSLFLGLSAPIYIIPLNNNYIKDVKATFNRLKETFIFHINSTINNGTIKLISPNGRYKEYYYETNEIEIIPDDFIYYTVKNPFFYQYEIKNSYDSVRGYVSVIEYELGKAEGINCLKINDEPEPIKGILNKNYYSDGLLTAPSYEHIEKEIGEIKKYRFNSIYNNKFIDIPYYYYYLEINGILSIINLNYSDKNLYKYLDFFTRFNNIYLYIIENNSKTKNLKDIYNEIKPLLNDKLLIVAKKNKSYGDLKINRKYIKSKKPYIILPLTFKDKDLINYLNFIDKDYIKYSINGMIGYYYDSLKDKDSGILTPNFKKRQNHSKVIIDFYNK